MRDTNLRIIKSGNLWEVFRYENRIRYGPSDYKKSNPKVLRIEDIERKENDPKKSSLPRTKSRLKRLVYANVGKWVDENGREYMTLFLTLTFAENLRSVNDAAYILKKFIQKFNYEITGGKKIAYAKYIAVPEFQKRGAVHYHIIFFNIPFIENIYDKINKIWGKGYFVLDTIKIKDTQKAVNYICKYLRKEIGDDRLSRNSRRYYPSRGLKKPIKTCNEKNNEFRLQYLPDQAKVFEENYIDEYSGPYNYQVYDLSQFPESGDMLLAINQLMSLE